MALVATVGGLSLSIYSLSLAYTNDYLESDEMVGASSGLILILGIGSVIGPIVVGLALALIGPAATSGGWPPITRASRRSPCGA